MRIPRRISPLQNANSLCRGALALVAVGTTRYRQLRTPHVATPTATAPFCMRRGAAEELRGQRQLIPYSASSARRRPQLRALAIRHITVRGAQSPGCGLLPGASALGSVCSSRHAPLQKETLSGTVVGACAKLTPPVRRVSSLGTPRGCASRPPAVPPACGPYPCSPVAGSPLAL